MSATDVLFVRTAALSDDELARGCLARDESAVRELTRRYNQRLYRLARSIVGDPADAEDAVQEAYLKAFASLDRFRGESALATWLTRIVINEALGRVRRRHPTVAWAAESETSGQQRAAGHRPAADPNPEEAMAQQEIQSVLERSIDDLPEAFRVVFVARFVEGLSLEETADLLGVRRETVKTRSHRAKRRLRADLERKLGATVADVFRFDGARCQRMTDAIVRRMTGTGPLPGNLPSLPTSNVDREP